MDVDEHLEEEWIDDLFNNNPVTTLSKLLTKKQLEEKLTVLRNDRGFLVNRQVLDLESMIQQEKIEYEIWDTETELQYLTVSKKDTHRVDQIDDAYIGILFIQIGLSFIVNLDNSCGCEVNLILLDFWYTDMKSSKSSRNLTLISWTTKNFLQIVITFQLFPFNWSCISRDKKEIMVCQFGPFSIKYTTQYFDDDFLGSTWHL